ncbi:MAG: hypothetical protein Q9M91_00320 [Candidatus Dojkabacteria bacterium]|nr:hypothetical protein [Candidatus Dojkabacteria bacterium]MDQ7020276.1 hypothetical protein [Candidatus Dojkabacteria bacterium]
MDYKDVDNKTHIRVFSTVDILEKSIDEANANIELKHLLAERLPRAISSILEKGWVEMSLEERELVKSARELPINPKYIGSFIAGKLRDFGIEDILILKVADLLELTADGEAIGTFWGREVIRSPEEKSNFFRQIDLTNCTESLNYPAEKSDREAFIMARAAMTKLELFRQLMEGECGMIPSETSEDRYRHQIAGSLTRHRMRNRIGNKDTVDMYDQYLKQGYVPIVVTTKEGNNIVMRIEIDRILSSKNDLGNEPHLVNEIEAFIRKAQTQQKTQAQVNLGMPRRIINFLRGKTSEEFQTIDIGTVNEQYSVLKRATLWG